MAVNDMRRTRKEVVVARSNWSISQKPSPMIAGLRAGIRTRNLTNTKQ